MITIQIDEITMRKATSGDQDARIIFDAIDTHRNDLRVWLPFVDILRTVEDEKAFLVSACNAKAEIRYAPYMIWIGRQFAGLAGYVNSDPINCRTEIGYWLLPSFRGKGIMSRCVKRLCQMAVNEQGMHRIQIRCAVGNHASNAIPLRLGFYLEGTERDGERLVEKRYTDIHVYSILEHEVNAWHD